MPLDDKFFVLPFKRAARGQLVLGEARHASSAASAERIADAMSARFEGVSAYAVKVDRETGDMTEPKLLRNHGATIDIMAP